MSGFPKLIPAFTAQVSQPMNICDANMDTPMVNLIPLSENQVAIGPPSQIGPTARGGPLSRMYTLTAPF